MILVEVVKFTQNSLPLLPRKRELLESQSGASECRSTIVEYINSLKRTLYGVSGIFHRSQELLLKFSLPIGLSLNLCKAALAVICWL